MSWWNTVDGWRLNRQFPFPALSRQIVGWMLDIVAELRFGGGLGWWTPVFPQHRRSEDKEYLKLYLEVNGGSLKQMPENPELVSNSPTAPTEKQEVSTTKFIYQDLSATVSLSAL